MSPFQLDRYEVTVGRFRQFVASYESYRPRQGQGAHPSIPESGWQDVWNNDLAPTELELRVSLSCQVGTWTQTADTSEELPIDCVDWFEAFLFCVWDGGRLPTDAEWSYAAGGADARLYPWGTTIDHSVAVYGCGFSDLDSSCADGRHVSPVGSESPQGDGAWGHDDLAGNVFEWVLDGDPANGKVVLPMPCKDCAGLATSTRRARGGGWWSGKVLMQNANSYTSAYPNYRWDLGFRCARDR